MHTGFQGRAARLLIGLAIALPATVASAEDTRPQMAQAFRDLPGVYAPSNAPPQDDMAECEQVITQRDFPFEPTDGPRYSIHYRCTKDGVTFESNHLPPNRERMLRGLPR